MIDSFVREKTNAIKCFGYEVLFAPINVPVIVFGLSIASVLKCSLNAVIKVCFEFNIRAALSSTVTSAPDSGLF